MSPGAIVSTGLIAAENWRWNAVGVNTWRVGLAGRGCTGVAVNAWVDGWVASPENAISIEPVNPPSRRLALRFS